jgi:hypothetical protein
MSNIKFDSKRTAIVLYVNYEEILQEKINSVCGKIGFDDTKITWFIFDSNETDRKNTLAHIRIGLNGKDYGFCIPVKNKIWISTSSIMKDKNLSLINKMRSQLKRLGDIEEDFLADVILDEITHIQTNCNHGSSKYDRKLQENAEKYYLPTINLISLQTNLIKKSII